MVKYSGNDLKISGYMRVQGGTFDRVKIDGGADLNSSVECSEMKVNGMANISGGLKAGYVKAQGKLYVRDSADCGDFSISGKCEIEGDLKAKDLKIEGSMEVKGSLAAEKVKAAGEVMAGEGLNAEELDIKGRIKVNGLLNAGKIKFSIYGRSFAGEIGGEQIEIRKGDYLGFDRFLRFVFSAFGYRDTALNAGIIEGDDIYLESTEARIVRGKRVVIGEGCVIGLVEYKESFRQENGGHASENKKI